MMPDDNAAFVERASSSDCHETSAVFNKTTMGGGILGRSKRDGFVSCSLKRKRPPKIKIPNVLGEISADTSEGRSILRQGDQAMCFADSGVAVFSVQGKKTFMEDAYKVFSSPNGNTGFFGVYDGHGGSKAVEFVAENLHANIFDMLQNSCENDAKEEAVRQGYLKTDKEFLKQGLSSGACCVTALIGGMEMVISNLGDCRAVLCRNGTAEAITTDHKPAREDERTRIEDKGGYVAMHQGTWRVHGSLAVSRSIGDAHLKDWVIADPDTKVIHLTPDMEFLVLASDGLWQEVSNQEAVDIITQLCSSGKKQHTRYSPAKMKMKMKTHLSNNENRLSAEKSSHDGMTVACKKLVSLAVSRGSLDDITVMIVNFKSFLKVDSVLPKLLE